MKIWGCVSAHSTGNLHIDEGAINGERQTQALKRDAAIYFSWTTHLLHVLQQPGFLVNMLDWPACSSFALWTTKLEKRGCWVISYEVYQARKWEKKNLNNYCPLTLNSWKNKCRITKNLLNIMSPYRQLKTAEVEKDLLITHFLKFCYQGWFFHWEIAFHISVCHNLFHRFYSVWGEITSCDVTVSSSTTVKPKK